MISGFVRRDTFARALCGVAVCACLAGSLAPGIAQVDCEAIPAGPARTDCYIGLSRIQRQESEIAAGVARQQSDAAKLRQVTGKSAKGQNAKKKSAKKKSAQKKKAHRKSSAR
jgi:hypothetical protein